MTDHLGRLLLVTLEAGHQSGHACAERSPFVARPVARDRRHRARDGAAGYDLQLTPYDAKGLRTTFYTTGMEHLPTSATGTRYSLRKD